MIRPLDLQNALIAAQSAPAVARAEPAQRLDAQATQAAFAHELDRRDEEVAATAEIVGNRVDARDGSREKSESRRKASRKPETAFAAMIDEAAGETEEPAHIVDFSA